MTRFDFRLVITDDAKNFRIAEQVIELAHNFHGPTSPAGPSESFMQILISPRPANATFFYAGFADF